MKLLFKLCVYLVVVLVVLFLARNFIIKAAMKIGVRAVTGMTLEVDKVNVNPLASVIHFTNLKLLNNKNFKDRVMIDMPELYVSYSAFPLLTKKIHIKEARLDLKEFMVVKNEKGEVNLDSLKGVKTEEGKKKIEKKEESKKPSGKMSFKVDLLKLKIGKALYKDYSVDPENPSVKEYNINIDEEYKDIDSVTKIVQIIVFKTLSPTNIGNLVNFGVNQLGDQLGGTLKGGTKTITDTANKAIDSVKNVFGGLFGKKEE
ncbi:hypothetical protein KKC59_04345 [bacterium]|nr:hypothetical protein [bacterium]